MLHACIFQARRKYVRTRYAHGYERASIFFSGLQFIMLAKLKIF